MMLTKRIYEPEAPEDGIRLLITRYYPRGVKRHQYTEQARDLSPSAELLCRYQNKEIRWEQFLEEFTAEIRANEKAQAIIKKLHEYSRNVDRNITLLRFEKEGENCHRYIVKAFIEES